MATPRQYLITDPYMLDHDISWYKIPENAPHSYKHRLSKRSDAWYKQALIFNLIAQGFTLEAEIKLLASKKADSSATSIYRAIKKLVENGLLYRTMLTMSLGNEVIDMSSGETKHGRTTLALLRLNRRGRGLCRTMATRMSVDKRWRPRETEWERMRRIHEQGKREPEHTLGNLVFAYQARQRGWSAGVMPDFQEGHFVPDAVVEKDGDKFFVEVELHYGKEAKWRNVHNALGYIAFCGRSSQHEETLLKECREVGGPVYATNLTDLITGKEDLWT